MLDAWRAVHFSSYPNVNVVLENVFFLLGNFDCRYSLKRFREINMHKKVSKNIFNSQVTKFHIFDFTRYLVLHLLHSVECRKAILVLYTIHLREKEREWEIYRQTDKQRKTDRHRDKQTEIDRQTYRETNRDRERGKQREREGKTKRHTNKPKERHIQTDRQTKRERETNRQTNRERQTDKQINRNKHRDIQKERQRNKQREIETKKKREKQTEW